MVIKQVYSGLGNYFYDNFAKLKLRCTSLSELTKRRNINKKKKAGFEPMTSGLPSMCSPVAPQLLQPSSSSRTIKNLFSSEKFLAESKKYRL